MNSRCSHTVRASNSLRVVGHVGELPFGGDRVRRDVVAGDDEPPARRRDDAGDGAHRRGLARAVGSEQSEDLPGQHFEAQALDRDRLPVRLVVILHPDHRPAPGDRAARRAASRKSVSAPANLRRST